MILSDRIFLMNGGRIEQQGRPEELYTAPRNHFAASFMGNYNILSSEDFCRATGKTMSAAHIAIRPEVIHIASRASGSGYEMRGILKEKELHGNVLRLYLDGGGFSVHADLLYDGSCCLREGGEYWMEIRQQDCILLPD